MRKGFKRKTIKFSVPVEDIEQGSVIKGKNDQVREVVERKDYIATYRMVEQGTRPHKKSTLEVGQTRTISVYNLAAWAREVLA